MINEASPGANKNLMKKSVIIFMLVLWFSTASAAGEEDHIRELVSICLENPVFKPSSIDNYDPGSASALEKEYYSIAEKLHKKGALNYVIQKRMEAESDRTKDCIQRVLETWPG